MQYVGQLGWSGDHRPVPGRDVVVRHGGDPGEFGHVAIGDPTSRIVGAELGADDGDGDIEPALVAELDDAARNTFGHRDRHAGKSSTICVVQVGAVGAFEWFPTRKRDHAVRRREDVEVDVAVRGREPTDHHDPLDSLGSAVSGDPAQRRRSRVPDDNRMLDRIDRDDDGVDLVIEGCHRRPVVDAGQLHHDGTMTEPLQFSDGVGPDRRRKPQTGDEDDVHGSTVGRVADRMLPDEMFLAGALMSPTARALRTLELIQTRPGITAAEIAERLEVSDRAARRYVAILREAGVTVESTRGTYGGYRLGRGLRVPPLVFTTSEVAGVVMAVLDGHHAASDLDDPVGSALDKLIRALPERIAAHAVLIQQHARAAPDLGAARPDPAITAEVIASIAAGRRAHLSYRSDSGSHWDAEIDPWAVVVRHGRWYLLCHAHHVDATRTYRLDRIQQFDALETEATGLPDDDPVAMLERHLGTGWEFDTHVVFDAPMSEVAAHIRPPMGRLESIGDGARCQVIGTTSNPHMYAGEWLAANPHPYRVIGGPELRDAVTVIARRMTDAAEDHRN